MKTGLLWADFDPSSSLTEKVRGAVAYYKKKNGAAPDVCYVHPSALGDNGKLEQVGAVRVVSRLSVLRHHFWVGVDEISSA